MDQESVPMTENTWQLTAVLLVQSSTNHRAGAGSYIEGEREYTIKEITGLTDKTGI